MGWDAGFPVDPQYFANNCRLCSHDILCLKSVCQSWRQIFYTTTVRLHGRYYERGGSCIFSNGSICVAQKKKLFSLIVTPNPQTPIENDIKKLEEKIEWKKVMLRDRAEEMKDFMSKLHWKLIFGKMCKIPAYKWVLNNLDNLDMLENLGKLDGLDMLNDLNRLDYPKRECFGYYSTFQKVLLSDKKQCEKFKAKIVKYYDGEFDMIYYYDTKWKLPEFMSMNRKDYEFEYTPHDGNFAEVNIPAIIVFRLLDKKC